MSGERKLAKKLANMQNPMGMRMGVIVSYAAGPPRTVIVTIAGVNVPGVPILDTVCDVTVDTTLWMVELGGGRLMGIATMTGTAIV